MARTLIVSDRHNSFFTANNIRVGNQLPTEGNYVKGDIIVNIGESTATEAMWICVESGNPGVWEVVGAGAGGGSLVSINDSVFVNEPVNEVSLAGLGVGVSSKDKLIVHHNSVHLMEGVDYEISEDGTKIVKLTEGNWNEASEENALFAFELFKGVESIDGDKIVIDSKLTSITNHVIIENACSEVEIGIEGFNAGNDMMLVFKNGVNMVEGVDYEVQDGKIVSTGEVWNENGIEDYGMTFVVFKDIPLIEESVVLGSEYIADGSIIMDKLADDVKEAIENASSVDLSNYATKEDLKNIDLSNYATKEDLENIEVEPVDISGKQNVTDNNLVTTDKTIVGAINELFQNANNGKELIASAIGEPVSADDTFQAMSDKINTMKNDLKTSLSDESVEVNDEDTVSNLISKVDTTFDNKNDEIANLNTTITEKDTTISTLNTTITEKDSIIASMVTPAGTATASNVDSGKTFINSTGQLITGTSTKVTPTGTAVASNVLSGKTFINSTGSTVTGTMTNMGSKTFTPSTSKQTSGAGYYSGITVNAMSTTSLKTISKSQTVSLSSGYTKLGNISCSFGSTPSVVIAVVTLDCYDDEYYDMYFTYCPNLVVMSTVHTSSSSCLTVSFYDEYMEGGIDCDIWITNVSSSSFILNCYFKQTNTGYNDLSLSVSKVYYL